MAIAHKEAINFIENLIDDHSIDEIIAELYFMQQIEQDLEDIDRGRGYSHEQIKDMMLQWRKSSGRN